MTYTQLFAASRALHLALTEQQQQAIASGDKVRAFVLLDVCVLQQSVSEGLEKLAHLETESAGWQAMAALNEGAR